tara:strand:+ start:240 stop:395 length:156 start_codon:yes stop_codon:yes gene_type:complete
MNIWENVMIDEKEISYLEEMEITEDVKIGLTNNDDEEEWIRIQTTGGGAET